MRSSRLTRVATPIALPTTAQYIFCRVNRLGTPSPMDIEPAGMSPIDMDILCWSCNRKHEIEPYKTLGCIWILPSPMTGRITNIMLIHAHLRVGPPCGHRFSPEGCGPMRQCVNASMRHFMFLYFSFLHSLDSPRPHFLAYQSWKAWI